MTQKNGQWILRRDHTYYYQIQTQLNVCNLSYCDFVVWTEGDSAVERITVDNTFYETVMEDVKHFFIKGLLPEIIGKWYTWKHIADNIGDVALPSTSAPATNTDDQFKDYSKIWCYCSQPSFGTMIMCNSSDCSIQWFHCDCLRIRNPPKGQWYCPACRKSPRFNNKKKSKQ